MKAASKSSVRVSIRRLDHAGDLPLPGYATPGSAGMDLAAALDSDVILGPGERTLVPTGFAIALPDGFEAQIRPRSGLAVRSGISVLNTPGTVDADYRGEVMVCLINHGDTPFTISFGDRIAQMVVAPVSRVDWNPADDLDDTTRADGGFGSTGLNTDDVKTAAGGSR